MSDSEDFQTPRTEPLYANLEEVRAQTRRPPPETPACPSGSQFSQSRGQPSRPPQPQPRGPQTPQTRPSFTTPPGFTRPQGPTPQPPSSAPSTPAGSSGAVPRNLRSLFEEFYSYQVPIPNLSSSSGTSGESKGPTSQPADNQEAADNANSAEDDRQSHDSKADGKTDSSSESLRSTSHKSNSTPSLSDNSLEDPPSRSNSGTSEGSQPEGTFEGDTDQPSYFWDSNFGLNQTMTRAGTGLVEFYEGASAIISQDAHEVNINRMQEIQIAMTHPVNHINTHALLIKKAHEAGTPVGSFSISQLHLNYAEWVKMYKELLTVLTAINRYLRQKIGRAHV